jgi:hypothetical protein
MIRQVSSTPSCRVKRVLSPTIAAWSSTSYGVAPSPPIRELDVELDRRGSRCVARWAPTTTRIPVDGSSLTTIWFGLRQREAEPELGRMLEHDPTSVCVIGRRLPVRMKKGTPDQRQFSISSRSAAYVSVVESAATPSMRGSRRTGRARSGPGRPRGPARNSATWASLIVFGLAPRRRLHRGRGDDLHEVVDDDVAQRADGVVEVPAILDAEVLGHRDLHALDVVAVPDGLEDRVREPQEEDLLEAHLPEVVVDPVELRLVDGLVQLVGERAGGLAVVPERLLDHGRGRSS